MRVWETWRAAVTTAVVAVAVCAAPTPARAEEHKDERLGYSVTYPRKWAKRPVSVDERWVVAKFECDREFEDSDPKTNFWSRHRPWMDVVIIPTALADRKGGTVEKGADGKVKLTEAAPWTDLKGYLEKNLVRGQGGFYFSKEDEVQVGSLKCVQYEVTFDKLIDSPKKVFAWAYYTEDAIYGLVGESLDRFEDKVRPDLFAAFKSFKAFARKGVLPGAEHTGEDVVVGGDTKDEDLDDDLRQRRREERTMKRLSRIRESLGSGWTVKESEHFIAVSHSDPKFTKSVLDHCEALRGWLDENLAYFGTGYAGRVIVRICQDREEYEALQKTAGWSSANLEVVTFKDKEGMSDWWGSFRTVNSGVFEIWMDDRNRSLSWGLPSWIRSGLRATIDTAESKGKKVEFRPATWDRLQMATQKRDGKVRSAKDYFSLTSDQLWGGDWSLTSQSEYFVRFLLAGGARKSAKFKNLFADYVKAVVFVLDEEEAARAKAERQAKKDREAAGAQGDDGPKDEKEEEELVRKRQQDWAQHEKAFLDKVYQRVFAAWTFKEWEALNSAYLKDLE